MTGPSFRAGVNVAMKIPRAAFDDTVAFYRDTLGFELSQEEPGAPTISQSYSLQFGGVRLWLDCVDNYARSDVWLELATDDIEAATSRLAANGILPCDEVEPLDAPGFKIHWIKNPAGVVHLLLEAGEEPLPASQPANESQI